MTGSRKPLRAADHQDKDVIKALKKILATGRFTLIEGSHWGMLRCTNGCCQIGVWGTPKNAQRHARDLLRAAAQCPRDDDDVRNKQRRGRGRFRK